MQWLARAAAFAAGSARRSTLQRAGYEYVARRSASLPSQGFKRGARPGRRKLAGPWKLEGLERLCHEVGLAELPLEIARILEGRQVGRALVRVD